MRCVNNSFIESAEDGGRGFRLQGHFQMPDKEGKTVRERDKVQERGLENKKHGKGLKMTPFRDYTKRLVTLLNLIIQQHITKKV